MKVLAKLRSWMRPSGEELAARALFAHIMRTARDPAYFRQGGVADTVDGRFDLVVAHLILMMRRLRFEGSRGGEVAQSLLDIAFANFDEALREMGVGDLSVPKKVKRMAEAFYGRVDAYERAFSQGGDAFEEALRRNLYRTSLPGEGALAWTSERIKAFAQGLDGVSGDRLLSGAIKGAEK